LDFELWVATGREGTVESEGVRSWIGKGVDVGRVSVLGGSGTVSCAFLSVMIGMTLVCSVCVDSGVDDDSSVVSPPIAETGVLARLEAMPEVSKLNGIGASSGTAL
jgi:hypothetical protein